MRTKTNIKMKYKFNIANAFWLMLLITPLMFWFGWLKNPSVSKGGLIIGIGSFICFWAAVGFNWLQKEFTDNHELDNNAWIEATVTGFTALIVAGPLSYLLFRFGLIYWQIVAGVILGAITIYLHQKK